MLKLAPLPSFPFWRILQGYGSGFSFPAALGLALAALLGCGPVNVPTPTPSPTPEPPSFITIVAGTGRDGLTGDGGPATAATLRSPKGLAVDSEGNLYIADWGNHRIRKVDAQTGDIATLAGSGNRGGFSGDSGPADEAQLRFPSDVATDAAGNVYVADTGNNRIRRVDRRSEVITTVAGTGDYGFGGDGGPATRAQLRGPNGVYVDAEGRLLVADRDNYRIRRVDLASSEINTLAGNGVAGFGGDGGPASAAQLQSPSKAVADAEGNIFIADTGNNRIRRAEAVSNAITTIAGPAPGSGINSPQGLAVDRLGNIYVANEGSGLVVRLGADGSSAIIAGPSPEQGGLRAPQGLAIDQADNLYIADTGNHRILKITP